MNKVIAMLVALALFGAIPAVATAQTPPGEGDTVSSGNSQDADIEQEAQGGGSGEGDNGNGHGGSGNAGNQAAICQQNAGGDAICDINQSQRFGGDVVVRRHGHGHGHGHGHRVHGVGGGGVTSVALARTGFDAWLLALLGGAAVAGGVGLLAAQQRGRLHS